MDTTINQLPPDFLRRMDMIPKNRKADAVLGLTQPRTVTLRVNTLKSDAESLRKELAAQNIRLTPVEWYPDAFILSEGSLRMLTETAAYAEGRFYVQSLSSMIPPLVLDPKPGDTVLDIAAAPGSKTTQIAALMGNTGSIVANDTSRTRQYRLRANLETQGVTNTAFSQTDGRSIWKTYPEQFDRVLVDVPCSMDGRFNACEPKTYEDWSMKKVRDLSLLQRWMLRSAISTAKKGATIVYATCTLSPEENEGVLDWILNKDKHAVTVEPIDIPGLPVSPSLTQWAGKRFDPQIQNAVRIYPSLTMEGFFVAKLLKHKSVLPSGYAAVRKPVFHQHPQKPVKRYVARAKRGHKRVS